ncbi:hypothetical protein RHGRI_025775 [Rhododendron griersonianum]|uniref:Uncharacterized protein n=1 Tax=Rhododendron griersonianum TaxID=479676 RepID=A0AAV6IRM0_9ERIC|nr:hypothetical protein RHGRI_025775 [Rhododendron griersonianum]
MVYAQFMGLLVKLMGGSLYLRVFLKRFCIPDRGNGCFSSSSAGAEAERVVVASCGRTIE